MLNGTIQWAGAPGGRKRGEWNTTLTFLCFLPWMPCDQRPEVSAALVFPAMTIPSKQTLPSLSSDISPQ